MTAGKIDTVESATVRENVSLSRNKSPHGIPPDGGKLKVLAVVDPLEGTNFVINCLVKIHQRCGGNIDVVLLEVQRPSREFSNNEGDDSKILKSVGRRLNSVSIPHRPRFEVGEPAPTIVRCAQEEDCNLIVLAELRTSSLGLWLATRAGITVGSVASVIVHLAPIPVLVAR